MPEVAVGARTLREAIDLTLAHGVVLVITADAGPYYFEMDGRAVTEAEIIALANALDTEPPSPPAPQRPKRQTDRGRRYALLGRALRILACHSIHAVVTSRDDGCEFEIDERPLREIDVIVQAAMIDATLLSEQHEGETVKTKHVA